MGLMSRCRALIPTMFPSENIAGCARSYEFLGLPRIKAPDKVASAGNMVLSF